MLAVDWRAVLPRVWKKTQKQTYPKRQEPARSSTPAAGHLNRYRVPREREGRCRWAGWAWGSSPPEGTGDRDNRQENTIKSREGKPTHFIPLHFFLLKRRFFSGSIDSRDISQQGASLCWQPSQSQSSPPGSQHPSHGSGLSSRALPWVTQHSHNITNTKSGMLRQAVISVRKKNIAHNKVMKFIHKLHSDFNSCCHIRYSNSSTTKQQKG